MPVPRIAYPVEYAVIASYLVLMLAIGFIFRNFNRGLGDYFRGGSQGTWWMVGMTSFMATISALTFTGNGGAAFQAGWSVTALYLANVVGIGVQAIVLAPWYRQLRATTFPEVILARFNRPTQQVYALLTVFTRIVLGAIWLLGLAIFSSTTLRLPIHLMIPLLGAVAMAYSTIGGKWAVMAAGFVQGLILMGMTLLLTVLCLCRTHGIAGFFAAIGGHGLTSAFAFVKPAGTFPGNAYTWQWVAAAFVVQVVANTTTANASKYFAVKDGREARWSAWLSCLLMVAGLAAWFVPPMLSRFYYESEVMASGMPKPAEAAFAITGLHLLPTGLVGMMVVAMFSATMCSLDAGLNENAAILVTDLLPGLWHWRRRKAPDERTLMRVSRIATMGFGVTIIGLADYFSRQTGTGIFEIMINFSALVGIPMSIPMVLCLFVRRVPTWSALFAIGAALLPAACSLGHFSSWTFQERTFWSTSVGVAAFLLTRFWWNGSSPAYRDQVDRFFATMHRPVDYAREVGQMTDGRQLSLMGRICAVVALFIACLLAVPNPAQGRWCIAALAAGIGGLAVVMLRAAGSQTLRARSGK